MAVRGEAEEEPAAHEPADEEALEAALLVVGRRPQHAATRADDGEQAPWGEVPDDVPEGFRKSTAHPMLDHVADELAPDHVLDEVVADLAIGEQEPSQREDEEEHDPEDM